MLVPRGPATNPPAAASGQHKSVSSFQRHTSIFPDVTAVLNRKEQGDATCVLSENPRYSAMLLSILISDTFQIWIPYTCLAPSVLHAASQLQQMSFKLPVLLLLDKGTISARIPISRILLPEKSPIAQYPA